MADDNRNVVVANALQLFTTSRSFKALANGRIYVGEPDTDPTIPSNQKQIFLLNESGSSVPIPQPVVINSGGHAVYGGQLIRKLSTDGNYSMAIYDAYGAQEYYFDNMARYDSDVLLGMISGPDGAGIVGYGESNVENTLYHTPDEFYTDNMDTALAASLAATASDGRRTWIKGNKSLAVTASVPQGVIVQNDGAVNSSASVSAFTTGNGATITGGKITTSSPVTAVRAWAADGVKVNHITANGSVLSNTPAAYALSSTSKDFNVSGVALSGYTGGIELSGTNRAVINGIKAEKMWFHASLGAGGYGVLLQGAVDSFITNLHFVAGAETSADGYNGRHGVYQSVLSGSGSVNTIVNGYIANYRDKKTASPGAINIRSNNRAVYSNMIIDNAHISGNLEDGDISNQIVSNAVIRNTKVTTSPAYGVDLGSSVSGNYVRSSLVSNAIISVQPATGISTDNCNGLVVSGKNGLMNGVIINVPELSYPLTVRAGVDNYLINGIIDYNSSGGGQSFILFDGACSNIKISGCKTGRRWFRAGNLTAVTNLTVDFTRSVIGSLNAGTPTYSDFYELVSTTSVSSTNIVITFNTHVTQAALDSAIATVVKAGVMAYPVIVSRSNKSLIIEFYSLAGGSIINPTSNAISFMINISC
ncbi:phage tailspike protein [Erwinia aphidicola]|uniref:phage tailspike protein n=1 Tax=Erwinia aphidicola TaxID=68334 RepID=UPI0030CCEC8C